MESDKPPDAHDDDQKPAGFSWPLTEEELATCEVVELAPWLEPPPVDRPLAVGAADAPAPRAAFTLAPVPEAAQEATAREESRAVPAATANPMAAGLVLLDEASAPAPADDRKLVTAPRAPAGAPSVLDGAPRVVPAPARSARVAGWTLAVLLPIVMAAGGFFAGQRYATQWAPRAATAALHVDSVPPGALVLVDGSERGRTPIDFTVAPGRQRMEVVAGTVHRAVEFSAAAGSSVSHHFDFGPVAGETATGTSGSLPTGTLVVRSDPPGAAVRIGGRDLGAAPLTVPGLAVGEHDVQLMGTAGPVSQRVQVQAGLTTTLVVPMAGRSASGWLAVRAPIELTLVEGGRFITTSRSDQTMLPAGRHEIEFVSEEFEFRTRQTVAIPPGRRVSIDVPMPLGRANINARPWAEVWIGDQRLGETPLGNVALPIGRHEVVFRHPQFGERRQTLVVKAATPARVVVDLTQ